MEIGRVCVKIAGRDAGRVCVIIDNLEGNLVLIDGNVRRRKCNIKHLEPLDEVLKIKKGASHSDIAAEFKKLKLETWSTKPKKTSARKLKQRKISEKPKKEAKENKAELKETKKEEKKEEKKAETKKEKPLKKKEVKK